MTSHTVAGRVRMRARHAYRAKGYKGYTKTDALRRDAPLYVTHMPSYPSEGMGGEGRACRHAKTPCTCRYG